MQKIEALSWFTAYKFQKYMHQNQIVCTKKPAYRPVFFCYPSFTTTTPFISLIDPSAGKAGMLLTS